MGLPRPDQARFSEHSTERDIRTEAHSAIPPAKGLFDPANDKDACGVGFVAQLSKVRQRPQHSNEQTVINEAHALSGTSCVLQVQK